MELWDWRVGSLVDGKLTVFGSQDFCYYHLAEVTFDDVTFLNLPTEFSHAFFRVASDDERRQYVDQADWEGELYCIVSERPDGERYFICSNVVQCKFGTVYYYMRPNLEQGERIAEWVK